jgi:protein TonB
METKKTNEADLERKSPLFFSIGLVLTMSMVVYAFEKKNYDNGTIDLTPNTDEFIPMADIPITEQTPPRPPVVKPIEIVEVPNDKDMEKDINIVIDANLPPEGNEGFILEPEEAPIEKTDDDEIFRRVEESAIPNGGLSAFYKYVADKIKYPVQAQRMEIQGRVFVEFVIGKDGSISEVRAVKGIGAGCDEEAVRIIQNAPAWMPGKQRGKPVKQRIVLPITFKLG